jgi:hypothetical protein
MSLILAQSFNLVSECGTLSFTEVSNFGPIGVTQGRFAGQQAAVIANTGFGFKYLDYTVGGSKSKLIFGFVYYQFKDGSGNWILSDVEVFKLTDTLGSTLALLRARPDGKLDFVTSSEVHVLNKAFNWNTWHYIELIYNTGGTVEVWVDDGLDTPALSSSVNNIELLRIGWANLGDMGIAFSDIYILDPSTGPYTDRLGPIRIDAWPMTGDARATATTSGPTQHFKCINDHTPGMAPDGDASWVQFVGGGADTYSVSGLGGCRGRILSLLLHTVAKASGGGNLQTVWGADPTSLLFEAIGAFLTPPSTYKYFQDVVLKNPHTSDYWADGDIEKSLWGLNSSSGTARITMFWIEKIQSLRKVPFQCGQVGSYVY